MNRLCPENESGYHWWTCDGPYHVTCDVCGAEGYIVQEDSDSD